MRKELQMIERFNHIDINNEKVKRIVNSALEEFSKNDFDKASTNNIVKGAGISRGLLYHYFKDKQDLYDFLIDFAIEIVMKALEEKAIWEEGDLLEKIKQAAIIKIEIFKDYPYMMEFLISTTEKITKRVEVDHLEKLREFYTLKVDRSKFKDNIDVDKAVNIIRWTIEKNGKEHLKKMQFQLKNGIKDIDLEPVMKEFDDYLQFFKTIFYK